MLFALSVAACSSGGEEGGSADSVAASLAVMPPRPEHVSSDITYGDLAEAADLAGVELPDLPADGDEGDVEDVLRSLTAMTGGPAPDGGDLSPVVAALPSASHFDAMEDLPGFAEEVGWSIVDVDGFVDIGPAATVLQGDFDEDRLTEALGDPGDDGVWIAGNQDGTTDTLDRTAARQLGEALWLSLVDDRLVVTHDADVMATVRAVGEGEGESLADNETLASLAEGLDGVGVYSALLTDLPPISRVACDESLEDYRGVAVGIADDDGPVVVLVYDHADAAAAAANAATVEHLVTDGESLASGEPWSERLAVDDITTDGARVVARLRPTEPAGAGIWRQIYAANDNLVALC